MSDRPERSARGGTPTVGVLALQGDFAAHLAMLRHAGAEAVEVRRHRELDALDALVIPGGESTTLLKLMGYEPAWWEALPRFLERGGAILGTCAGLILLAREVTTPGQRGLGMLDVTVARNAYGRQRESFESIATWVGGGDLEVVFIRAPRILSVGSEAEVLATYRGEAVLVRQGRVLGATFHPELTADPAVHGLLIAQCGGERPPSETGRRTAVR